MKKLILLGMIGAVATVWIAKKTDLFSYTGTFLAQAEKKVQKSVPNDFKIDHIRREISKLDSDISDMARPLAEYTVSINKLRKEIDQSEITIKERRQKLLSYLDQLNEGQKFVKVGDTTLSADSVKLHLERGTRDVEQLDKQVKIQKQVLDAKETCLRATQEQLAKVITKRDEYKIRVTQLEAKEAQLKVAKIGSDIKLDDGRSTKIEALLNEVEEEQNVLTTEIELLRSGTLSSNPLLNDQRSPATDLQALRKRLEGGDSSDKTASK